MVKLFGISDNKKVQLSSIQKCSVIQHQIAFDLIGAFKLIIMHFQILPVFVGRGENEFWNMSKQYEPR